MADGVCDKASLDPSRRNLLKTLALGAGALAMPGMLRSTSAQAAGGDVILRAIPKTGEKLPAIGLGTFMTFDIKPGQPRDHLREIIKRFYDGGGRVVDTSPLYGMSEVSVGDFATALGITRELFITNKTWATGQWLSDDSQALAQLRQSLERLWRDQIDVMQCHSLVNVPVIVKILKEWKKDGRIRYLGVTHHELPYYGPLAQWVEKGDLDFVQVHYSIHTRVAEERILPAAMDKRVAVQVNSRSRRRGCSGSSRAGRCRTSPKRSVARTGRTSF
jgi:diketogulonate reductase-like aldo/keto reductase